MTQREASKKHWNSNNTVEDINSGCLQRIADATEAMAKNYVDLQNERDRLIARVEYRDERITKLENRIRGLKGVITKLKK